MSVLHRLMTPGPWRVSEMCGGCINIEADSTPRRITVGRIHVFGMQAEAEANARLIAAAPDLLAAAVAYVALHHEAMKSPEDAMRLWVSGKGPAEIKALETAIARAEGRQS